MNLIKEDGPTPAVAWLPLRSVDAGELRAPRADQRRGVHHGPNNLHHQRVQLLGVSSSEHVLGVLDASCAHASLPHHTRTYTHTHTHTCARPHAHTHTRTHGRTPRAAHLRMASSGWTNTLSRAPSAIGAATTGRGLCRRWLARAAFPSPVRVATSGARQPAQGHHPTCFARTKL